MIIFIPLGGIGNRFKTNNYTYPKALINVLGKPIIYWLLDNLKNNVITSNNIIYITYNKEYTKYRFEDKLKNDYPNFNFIFYELVNQTRGAAETIYLGLKNILNLTDQEIICLDGDNFYNIDIINKWNKTNEIFVCKDKQYLNDKNNSDNKSIFSHVKIDDQNNILDIVEKKRISEYICTGAYGFGSFYELYNYSKNIVNSEENFESELFISLIVKNMLNEINFKINEIPKSEWICLGTPLQIRLFCNNYPKKSCINNKIQIKSLRICFDLDNTLVTFPTIKNDYTTVKPIMKNINFLKYLKKFGHTIIIYTARRMKTHNGNIGKIMCDIGRITFDTLDKFNIPFDEIYFGKPYADIYIDDLALNCFDDLEKNLGFYINKIDTRDFNHIESETINHINVFTKSSNDLSGEIYYYKNIPIEIKDMFAYLIDYDNYNKWFKMSEINGITASILYVNELLTPIIFKSIMESVERIHNVQFHNESINDINIYENYYEKLINRYNKYDYTQFENSYEIYTELCEKLKNYEINKYGKVGVIHGDPVFTNIIINEYDKIKFIDMRGKIGNKLTIYGDKLYDWAKIYQSLIGYDKILLNKEINVEYENKMIEIFKKFYIEKYSENDFQNLKLITKSLIFTLIPLHSNNNTKFYNLLFNNNLV